MSPLNSNKYRQCFSPQHFSLLAAGWTLLSPVLPTQRSLLSPFPASPGSLQGSKSSVMQQSSCPATKRGEWRIWIFQLIFMPGLEANQESHQDLWTIWKAVKKYNPEASNLKPGVTREIPEKQVVWRMGQERAMGYSQTWPVTAANCRAEPCHPQQPFTTLWSKAGSQDEFQGRGTMVEAARKNMKKVRVLERRAAFHLTVLEAKAGSFGPDQPLKLLSSPLLGKCFSKLTPEGTHLAKGQTGRRLPIYPSLLQ